MANSEDTDLEEQFDLGLHCLSRCVCKKTSDHYSTINHAVGGKIILFEKHDNLFCSC